jgi:hypothetical protein
MVGNGGESSEIYLELSSYARATVHALQIRKEGSGPVNWLILAKDLNLTVEQLKTVARIQLPSNSIWISIRSLSERN